MSDLVQEAVFSALASARAKADRKWGDSGADGCWLTNPGEGITVLGEEFGEVCRAVLERRPQALESELIDVAQVAVAWLESIEKRRRGLITDRQRRV